MYFFDMMKLRFKLEKIESEIFINWSMFLSSYFIAYINKHFVVNEEKFDNHEARNF